MKLPRTGSMILALGVIWSGLAAASTPRLIVRDVQKALRDHPKASWFARESHVAETLGLGTRENPFGLTPERGTLTPVHPSNPSQRRLPPVWD